MNSPRSQRHGPFEVKVRNLTVSALETLSPSLTRVVLEGPELEGFRSLSPDDHVKVVFPKGDERVSFDPTAPASTRPPMRDFTPRQFDADKLVLDFVVHAEHASDGPAARWIRDAKVGSKLGIGGPRGALVVAQHVETFILMGDETAVPAIARRLDELTAGQTAHVLIEMENAEHEIPLKQPVRWLHRAKGESLVNAIADLPKPTETTFVWGAAESSVAREIRAHFTELPKDAMRITGYWKRGVADHHD